MRQEPGERPGKGLGRPRAARWAALVLAAVMVAGCATGRAVRTADVAATKGDWDTAVAFYRQALGNAPSRADLKIKLERATRMAAAEHARRARELEAQDQIPGAIAEYRLAADLDPTSTQALSRALNLERMLRERVEANRPRTRVETLRDQNAQSPSGPRLDPRISVPQMRFPNAAVRDLLRTVSSLTGINILYDQGLDQALSRPYPIDIQNMPLEDVLTQILQANALTFKVQNPKTIFVYQDSPVNRQKYEDQYLQTFYLSSADPTEMQAALNQLLAGTQIAVRPQFTVNKIANALTVKATLPVLEVIAGYIDSNDRGIPEVLIEAEILEVDRNYVRQLGLDLNQWALGFAFSPEVGPGSGAGTFPPATPPPFNLNTISQGVSAADFYMTSPTAVIKLLESNVNTKLLARPQIMGSAGQQISLTLGDQVPIPTTVFNSAAGGGVANIPTTSVSYTPVGVNLMFTPRVNYQDEIVLDALTLEKSGLGANLDIGGQTFPTIVSRKATTSLRLRDGESHMIAGLLLDDERKTIRSLPGLTNLPVLRSIFGNSERRIDQTDIVMIITPRIVRGHNLTAQDLRPMYIGTGQNMSTGTTPTLISPDALNEAGGSAAPAGAVNNGGPAALPPAAAGGPQGSALPPQGAGPSRASAIVPIQPAVPGPLAAPGQPAGAARVIVSAPGGGPDGALVSGGGPFTMPIQIADAADIATLSVTVTFNPGIIRSATVTQGSFMMQGGVSPTFVPGLDAASGRIDMVFSRPPAAGGASGAGLVAAISFTAGMPGTSEVSMTGVATTADGRSIPLQFTPARITVR